MKTSNELKNIYTAIIKARPEIAPIARTKSARNYKYATLDSVIELLSLVLPKHGLGWIQTLSTEDGQPFLVTRIIHESGEWIEDAMVLLQTKLNGGANESQELGASITYFKRYALSAIFGIATDDDTDGVAEVNERKQKVRATAKAAQQQTETMDEERIADCAGVQNHSQTPAKPLPAVQGVQTVSAGKKIDPLTYIRADFDNRLRNGETPKTIIKDYADILKKDAQLPIDSFNADEAKTVATELFCRAKRNRQTM